MSEESFGNEFERLREAFLRFGLSGKETEVYLALVIRGRMKASDLSRELRMHRLDVYNALKSLQAKEVVEASLSKPMTFKASPLNNVIESLKRKHDEDVRRNSEALEELEDAVHKLSQLLIKRNLQGEDSFDRTERIQILSGRKAINEKWSRLISSANSEILVVAMEKGAAQGLLSSSIDVITRKIRDGVKVRIFMPITKSTASLIRPIQNVVRHLVTSSSAGLFVVDGKHAMIVTESYGTLTPGNKREDTAILTDSKSIVNMFRTLYFEGWSTSPLVEEAIQRISVT